MMGSHSRRRIQNLHKTEKPRELSSPRKVEAFAHLRFSVEDCSRLLKVLYEGAFEPIPWSSFLVAVREQLKASWVTLILRLPSASQQALIINAGPNGVELPEDQFVSEYAFAMDPFTGLPEGEILSVGDVIRESEWMASEFYRQFCAPYGVRYIIGADLHTPGGVECRLRVCRPTERGNFSVGDRELCKLLLPHLRQTVHLHANIQSIDTERTLYASTVNRMLVGTVILDEDGAILKTNPAANEILAEKDGLTLLRGELHADYPEENRELQKLIGKALGREAGGVPSAMDAVSITRPSGRHKLGVLVRAIPLSEWSGGRKRPSVAIFIRDSDRYSQASHALVRRLFDLTPAEASLALLLVNGLTLEEAAVELDIRKNTARAHLRSIFSKTGVTRQTTLVHLLLNSVASLG